eukprot:TRINITY_DN32124_c0_g1_i1.p1 TRINITY_DN32124_c0_g1~~TRINITY_DN32124_c0_g1_i1.p1  ORF type:complete len:232 (+),score=106.14 TRINITY_DN32124_c0_g1_i1:158-853(+)
MKDWEVQSALQSLEGFKKPKIELEQYATPAELATHFLCAANRTFDDIEGKRVLDLGCGAGMLSIGAALLGADTVTGCDIDEDALETAKENRAEFELEEVVDFVRLNVVDRDRRVGEAEDAGRMILPSFRTTFDTVILNPPFGANKDRQQKGIDLLFLHTALAMCSEGGAVYSLHKSSTREHIERVCEGWGAKAEPLGQYNWNLAKTYKHQKKASKDIAVDMWRLTHTKKRQ